MHARTPTPSREDPRAPLGPATLDELAAMSVTELDGLYRRASAPDSLDPLEGAPVGRMLSVRGLDRPGARGRVAELARAGWFPWRGKSFRALHPERGDGINRTTLLGERFPFELSFGDSAVDGRPCVILDYDLADNPGFIRAIHDELRQLRPGLFLGPAMLKTRRHPVLVLYFAIDTR